MNNNNLHIVDYIKSQLAKGVGRDKIKSDLVVNKWKAEDIDAAFVEVAQFEKSLLEIPAPTQDNKGTSPSEITQKPSLELHPIKEANVDEEDSTSIVKSFNILCHSLEILSARAFTFFGISVIPLILEILALKFIETPDQTIFSRLVTVAANISDGGSYKAMDIFQIFAPSISILLIEVWSLMALIYAIMDEGEEIGILEAYKRGFGKILHFYWVMILTVFLVIGGAVFLIVPGIIFLIWFCLSLFVLVGEDLGGTDAVFKSKEYVKGHWNQVFIRFMAILIISLICAVLLRMLFDHFNNLGLNRIYLHVLMFLLSPLVSIYLFLIYDSLKTIRGHFIFMPSAWDKLSIILFATVGIGSVLAYGAYIMIINKPTEQQQLTPIEQQISEPIQQK
jgi:hypothetical protein